jgi:AcrR family transcriptional regulator
VEQIAGDTEVSGRDKLMEAAASLFCASAFKEVSVAELTKASGVQAPTLYHHFKDKEGLYVAWAESALRKLGRAVTTRIEGKTSTRDQLVAVATALLECRDLDLMVVMRDAKMASRTQSQERILQAYLAAIFEPLGGVMVRGIERGKLRPEPIARMANVFVLGALSLGRAYAMESIEPEDGAAWWTKRFINGFGG